MCSAKRLWQRWGVVIIFAASAVALFAIAGWAANADWALAGRHRNADRKHTTLRLLHAFPVNMDAVLRKQLDRFEKTHPTIRVRLEKAPGHYTVKLQAMMAGDAAPDVIELSDKNVASFAKRGALLDLKPFIQRDQFDLADFYRVGIRSGQVDDDSIYCLPLEGSGSVLYYNKDLFDRAGLPYPDGRWTWETFLDAARKLTRDTDGDGRVDERGFAMEWSWSSVLPWIWENGGDLFDASRTRCTLSEPAAVEALEFLVSLRRKHRVTTPSLVDTSVAVDTELFTNGRVAMFIYLAYGIDTFAQVEGFRWGVSPVPLGKHGRFCRYTSSGFSIWSGSRHPQESWQLVKFLTSPRVMRALCESWSYVPARKSVTENWFLRQDVPWNQQVFVQALDEARPLPNVAVVRELNRHFQIELDRALLGETSVLEAAERITSSVNEALDESHSARSGLGSVGWDAWPFALLLAVAVTMAVVLVRRQGDVAPSRTAGWRTTAGYLFVLPNFLGFLVFTLLPIAGSLVLAFFAWDVLTPPKFVGLSNFSRLAGDELFWKYAYNTVFLLLALPLNVVLSLLLAMVLNQKLRGSVVFRTIFFLPTIMAGVAIYMLWRWLYEPEFGLINQLLSWFGLAGPDWLGSTAWSKPALMLMSLWIGMGGLNMILYLAALQRISPELYEAAALDGAGWWPRFRHIVWPMVSPTTFFIAVTGTIAGLEGGFDAVYIMTRGGPAGSTTTISYYIYNNAFEYFHMGYAATIAWFLFAVVFLVTLIGWRYGGRLVHY